MPRHQSLVSIADVEDSGDLVDVTAVDGHPTVADAAQLSSDLGQRQRIAPGKDVDSRGHDVVSARLVEQEGTLNQSALVLFDLRLAVARTDQSADLTVCDTRQFVGDPRSQGACQKLSRPDHRPQNSGQDEQRHRRCQAQPLHDLEGQNPGHKLPKHQDQDGYQGGRCRHRHWGAEPRSCCRRRPHRQGGEGYCPDTSRPECSEQADWAGPELRERSRARTPRLDQFLQAIFGQPEDGDLRCGRQRGCQDGQEEQRKKA